MLSNPARHSRIRTVAIFGTLLFLAACEGTADNDAVADPKNSNGSALVTSSGARYELELRLDGNELDLVPIGYVRVARDGSIAVPQQQDDAIRFFAENGDTLGTVGRDGSGPGEFRFINRMGWMADTLWAFDPELERFSLFAPDRRFVRTLLVPAARPAAADRERLPHYGFVYPRALYTDGTYLAFAGTARGQALPSGYDRLRTPWLRISNDGEIRSLVGWAPEDHSFTRWETATANGSSAIPFAAGPREEVSADGSRIVFVTTDTEGEHAGTFQVVALTASGDTIFARRYPFAMDPIPDALMDSVMNARLENARRPEAAAALRRARLPTVYPPIADMFVAQDSTVWIRLRRRNETVPWVILDRAGNPADTLRVTQNLVPVEAFAGKLYAIEHDEFDVESVLRYRLGPKR
jgi:hypothetical protein